MPELPEVETVRRTLHNIVLNKTIENIDIRYSKIIKDLSPSEFSKNLIGKTIKDISRYGKYLIFIFEDIALISHLRMEGKYYFKKSTEIIDKHEHIIFNFTDKTSLRYHDVRKFGTMNLRLIKEIYTTNPIKKLGLEPLNPLLDAAYLKNKLQHKRTPIKTSLLDQTIITGLGNIYVDEVLFLAKINPSLSSFLLTRKDYVNIIKNAKIVLQKAIELGGTTIRSYTSSLGVNGLFQNELNVHTKEGKPCIVCNNIIEKKRVNGRGTYFCPKCQK